MSLLRSWQLPRSRRVWAQSWAHSHSFRATSQKMEEKFRKGDGFLDRLRFSASSLPRAVSLFAEILSVASFLTQLSEEPDLCRLPIPHNGLGRHLQYVCCLLNGQSAEESQLDDLAHARIEVGQ